MDNTLPVKITANIADLQNKFAAAKAATSQLGDALNALSKQAQGGTISGGLVPQLKDTTAAVKEAADIWNDAAKQIDSAEDSLVKDVLEKRKGLSRDLVQIAERLAETEIADDVKMWTAKILNATVAQGKIAAIEKGGVLSRAVGSLFGDGSTDSGAAAAQQAAGGAAKVSSAAADDAQSATQTAALSSNTAALTALTTTITGHGAVITANSGATLSNTGATLTGGAVTATSTGAITANTAAQSSNFIATIANTISTDALTVAQWASAAIEAIGDIMPFASGADNIPNDMVAMVHKGEMIIPPDHAARSVLRVASGDGN